MSLTFLEHAAIACYSTPTPERPNGASSREAIDMAQTLADASCARWGHDRRGLGWCERCGKAAEWSHETITLEEIRAWVATGKWPARFDRYRPEGP